MEHKEIIWRGEDSLPWRIQFAVEDGVPAVTAISAEKNGAWEQLAGPLYPRFEVSTGRRRMDAQRGKNPENRWEAYGDSPIAAGREEVAEAAAEYTATKCEISKDGLATLADFDGLRMGFFHGGVRFTVYEGSNLIRIEAIAQNDEHDSLAYMYRGALSGFHPGKLYYRTLRREMCSELPRGKAGAEKYARVFARNRVLTMSQENGSVAVLPPPHKFFFPRQLEINHGFNFYRKEADGSLTLGVRHHDRNGYYEECPNQRCWPLYNAKFGTVQRMAFYLAVSTGDVAACREMVMRYTHDDQFLAVPGYKRMADHFHMATREFYLQDPSVERPWEILFKELGVDIAYLNDFHGGDGHTEDTGELRRKDLEEYFEACREHTTKDFLIMAGEEPNNQIPGHWNVFFPKPVYFSRNRAEGQAFVEQTDKGPYYHLGSPEDITAMLNAEDGVMLLPHPRTKASEGCPDAYKDSALFHDKTFLGVGFRYMPADNSTARLIDGRNEETWNDVNNWSDHPKYMLGEVDTYQKNIEYDLYGDFNINYVKIGDTLPGADDYATILKALKAGEVFVSTGEVLIPSCEITDGSCTASLSWTFPMSFAEVVYSDGETVDRVIVSMTDRAPFGSDALTIDFPKGMKWARFAAWDTAGNGAFCQPVFLRTK